MVDSEDLSSSMICWSIWPSASEVDAMLHARSLLLS